jgi:hypothetical protein
MRTLTLPRSSRVYRVYRWALGIWAQFADRDIDSWRDDGDNLCHLVRIMVLGVPTVLASHLATLAIVVACVFVLPVRWYGAGSYFGTVAITGLGVGLFLLIIAGLDSLTNRRVRRLSGDVSTFARLIGVYTHSKLHEAICPWIEFKGER